MSESHQPTQAERRHVLVVDDDQVSRFIIGKWLKVWNVTASFCIDARSGLEAFQKNDYCLAIIDHYLPDTTGVELIKAMRLHQKPMPSIALHSTDLELHHTARENGIPYFLPKPFTSQSLYNILHESACQPTALNKKRREERCEPRRPLSPNIT